MRRSKLWAAAALAAAQTLGVAGCAARVPPPAPQGAASESTTSEAFASAPGMVFGNPSGAPGPEAAPDADFPATKVPAGQVPVPAKDAPSRGPAGAPITIQVFSDFECPYCAFAVPVLRQLENEFGGSIRVVWRNFPLPMHPQARLCAAAALEVYFQRGGAAFWRFHDALFQAQEHGLDPVSIERLALQQGVDPERYRAAIDGKLHDASILADLVAGSDAGLNGTPAFFVNDWVVVGALPYEEFRRVVVQALRDRGL